jgi:hypothetical protein
MIIDIAFSQILSLPKKISYINQKEMLLEQGWPNLVTSEANFMKNLWNSMKTRFNHFNFPWKIWNIVCRRILNLSWTDWPIKLNKILRSWIESRKLYAKFQICKYIQSLRIQEPQYFFGALYWSHQKRPWPQKKSEGLTGQP